MTRLIAHSLVLLANSLALFIHSLALLYSQTLITQQLVARTFKTLFDYDAVLNHRKTNENGAELNFYLTFFVFDLPKIIDIHGSLTDRWIDRPTDQLTIL